MAEGDLEIELKEEETPPPGGAKQPDPLTPGAGSPSPDTVSADVAELQRNLDEERKARIAAETRANAALQRAAQVERGATDDRLSMVTTALDTIDANLTMLEGQMVDAQAAGDFTKVASINRQMAEQAAQKPDLLRGKAALEHAAKNPQPLPTQPGPVTDAQKIDLYVQNMEPRAAAWCRAHPQFVTDTKLNDALLEQHYGAKRAGHTEGTDAYFRFIEDGLQLPPGNGHAAPPPIPVAAGGTEQALSAAAAPTQRRDAQPPAAAPSRGGGGSRRITLTPAQQEAARMSGQTYEEYAVLMERERKAGNIGKRLN